jgi:UDP-N-acetylmuramoyl-tripeptide--D-alanyl-D-alanine ligase
MSPLWTAAEAAEATKGRTTGDWRATGVSIDTRTLAPGDLFVALKDVRDGHDFVSGALANGAAAALVSRVPEGVSPDAPLLIVPDVLAALEALGRAGRARSRARVVAITGSVGKTSTKDMLRFVLTGQGRVHAAEKSYNNHWGVPLTLARLPQDADFAVVEIGMNHPGEIAPLARMARPHVAIVTTVGAAHLEAFGNLDGIAVEKASIFEGLEPGGTAIFHGDLPQSSILAEVAARHAGRSITFGTGSGNHHRALDLRVQDEATVTAARLWRTPVAYCIHGAGRHFAVNALAVLAAVGEVGADRARAIVALSAWEPTDGRGKRERIALDMANEHLTFDLIDDAFNANPASMSAALDVLGAAVPMDGLGRVSKGRRIAILGDMLELGPDEERLHVEIGLHPAMTCIAVVHCVGPRMRALWEALPEKRRGQWADTADELAARVHHLIDAGDVVLVKGSKGSKVSRVVDAIRKLGHAASRHAQGAD